MRAYVILGCCILGGIKLLGDVGDREEYMHEQLANGREVRCSTPEDCGMCREIVRAYRSSRSGTCVSMQGEQYTYCSDHSDDCHPPTQVDQHNAVYDAGTLPENLPAMPEYNAL